MRSLKNMLLILIPGFIISPGLAQDQSSDQMLIMWKNSVSPEKTLQYEEVVKKQIELLTKLNHPYPYFIYKTDNHFYYWVTYLPDFASMNEMGTKWQENRKKLESQFGFDQAEEFKDKINFITSSIINWRTDLSFTPDGQSFDPQKAQFFRMGFCYVKVGYEADFETNWRDWVALFKKYNIKIGWNTYQGIIGVESPLYIWGETYDSPLDMEQKRSEAFGMMGGESDKLWQETQNLIRQIEYEAGWYRPDLSYIPQQ